jgi:hypothetical protein
MISDVDLDPHSLQKRFWEAAHEAGRFFMGDDPVHAAVKKITGILNEAQIPYALVGAMALNAYGHRRVTIDVDLLLTREGLARLKELVVGLGYVEKFPGSKNLRDTENNVGIDFIIAGDYPGDGKPKAVSFPDPAPLAVRIDDIALLPIERFVELKLASGLAAVHRLKDLADVLELIKAAQLPRDLQLDGSVVEKYRELWDAAQVHDPISDG